MFQFLHTSSKNRHSLADGTLPVASVTVELQVRLEVEALYVFAVVTSGRQADAAVRYGTLERHLDGRLFDAVFPRGRHGAAARRHRREVALDYKGTSGLSVHGTSVIVIVYCNRVQSISTAKHRQCLLFTVLHVNSDLRDRVQADFKGYSLLVMQCSAGNSRFRNKPCNTDFTLGRCTNCNTNKCDCNKKYCAVTSPEF